MLYLKHLCFIEKEEVCQLRNEIIKSKEKISELEQSMKNAC